VTPGARWRSPRAGFAAALLLALAAAGAQGVLSTRDETPPVTSTARVGEAAVLGGTTVVVDAVTTEAGDPDVAGPAGSVLVLVVFTQRVDATVDLERHFCTSTLVADDGSVWDTDDELGYRLRRPEASTCGDDTSDPIRPGEPRQIGASFLIPARYADQVRWRLSLEDDRTRLEVRP
jgi:hypothetical protein